MTVLTFTERWFPAESCVALGHLVRAVDKVPGRIVEIGSWEGVSTITIARAARRTIHAVDTWEGSPGEESAELAAGRDVYGTWRANIRAATTGNVEAYVMDWRKYSSAYTSPVALLFIDAEHTYREVSDAIDAFLPMMSPGGVMCGDDVHHEPVLRAVLERFPDAETQATMWIARLP